jgi:hypothetical protein
MKLTLLCALILVLAVGYPSISYARVSHGSHSRNVTGLRTSTCKTSKCRSKHPSGTYVHPITPKK